MPGMTQQNEPVSPPDGTPRSLGSGTQLARHMGLFSLVVYGVGDMIGSGIYGTVGKAAGQMGNAVWLAFIVSMVAAMLTGLSYASISSRYPRDQDRKSTRLNSSHSQISYAVFCLKKKTKQHTRHAPAPIPP